MAGAGECADEFAHVDRCAFAAKDRDAEIRAEVEDFHRSAGMGDGASTAGSSVRSTART